MTCRFCGRPIVLVRTWNAERGRWNKADGRAHSAPLAEVLGCRNPKPADVEDVEVESQSATG